MSALLSEMRNVPLPAFACGELGHVPRPKKCTVFNA
jgi:hypothetical protein